MANYISILKIVTKFPPFRYSIKELVELLGNRVSDEAKEFFINSLGISTVYHSIDYTSASMSDTVYTVPHVSLIDMYANAARECLEKCSVSPRQVSSLIVADDNMQLLDPAATSEIMERLGLASSAMDFHLQGHACSSLARALSMIANPSKNDYALILIGNYYSAWFFDIIKQTEKVYGPNEINLVKQRRKDFNNCNYFLQFSDNATALLLSGADEDSAKVVMNTITSRTGTQPEDRKIASLRLAQDNRYRIVFDMDVNTKHLRERLKQLAKEIKFETMKKAGITDDLVKVWNLHTGGKVYVDAVREECDINYEKCKLTYDIMKEIGNTGASSSAILIKETIERKMLDHGEYGAVLDFGWGPKADAFLYTA